MTKHTPLNTPPNTPDPYGLPEKKTGGFADYLKGKLKFYAIALPILLVIGWVSWFISTSAHKNIQATSQEDFSAVCKGGSVANASDLAKPYKVAAFSSAFDTGGGWGVVGLLQSAPYTVQPDQFKETNVVVCISENSAKRATTRTKTCTFQQGTFDYYATTYKVTAHEAKTGKKIAELGEIDAPANTCPYVDTYDANSPKIIAKPNIEESDALDKLVAAFAQ